MTDYKKMPSSMSESLIHCGQLILDYYDIRRIQADMLANMLIIPSKTELGKLHLAARILRELGWDRTIDNNNKSTWHRNGIHKIFDGHAVGTGRKWAAMMLGITKERLMQNV